MAQVLSIICERCGEQSTIVVGAGCLTVCDACVAQVAAAKRKQHLDELKALSLEERISRIEELIHDRPWGTTVLGTPRYGAGE